MQESACEYVISAAMHGGMQRYGPEPLPPGSANARKGLGEEAGIKRPALRPQTAFSDRKVGRREVGR